MAEGNVSPELSSDEIKSDDSMETVNVENPSVETVEGADNAMDRFLQKSRSELMYELRRIQHGDRPVTGQGNKEQVDQFFSKRFQSASNVEGNDNVPSNVDAVEEHRPEAVVVEVQGLYEQRRVSAMLQSDRFRRQLENIIRGSISSAPRREQPVRLTTPRPPPPPPVHEGTSSRASTPLNPTGRNGNVATESVPGTPPEPREQTPASRTTTPPTPAPRTTVSSPPGAAPTEPNPFGIQNLSEVRREDLIQDIRELVQQQIVSDTLQGEFRGTLEVLMQTRVPENGTEVADFVRHLERSDFYRRNDFSNLGIDNVGVDDNLDNISVTSISAHAVPYTHSNLHMSREIASLKSQLQEMKNMMKLSFDLQMDIQRSIRQEVAAAMNKGTSSASTASSAGTRPMLDGNCLICLDASSDTVLYQCGHMCLCYKCGKDLQARGHNCPVCRAPIKDIMRVYRAN